MIRISTESGLRHSIEIGPHRLHADVPAELGGTGSAPEPHDLFDAALGACQALTLMFYAQQRGMPLDSLGHISSVESSASPHLPPPGTSLSKTITARPYRRLVPSDHAGAVP